MMDKLAKAQKNWMSKLVLILTALSFMSLFGVSGYLTGAARNKPVIKVDDIRISQQQFSALFEQEQQMARSLFGDNLQINDEIRNAMLQGLVQRELTNAIIERTADKLNMHISDNLVRKIIYSQAEFLDANGNFSLERLRRVLSASGWTEQRYIDALKKDIVKQQLVQNPSVNMNVPKVLADGLAKVESQKKTFKYIVVDPAKVKIDRKITPEETEQYYEDFSTNFIEPEKRDVSFIVLSIDDMAKKVVPEEADIEAYYEENIGQFETPETRKILQMVFDSREDADKAMTELKSGKDFYAVAQETAGQDKETTDLGYVAKDLLIADMAEKYDTYVITDEVYEHIVYAPYQHTYFATLPGMWQRTISCSSLSKTYSITGWRLGYTIAPPEITDRIKKVHDFLTVGAAAPLQEAVIPGLRFGQEYYNDLLATYTRKRDLFVEGLDAIGLQHTVPQGAYYILMDISEFGFDSDLEFCEVLARDVGVGAVPGSSFFREPVNHLIRFHFAKRDETLCAALNRLETIRKKIPARK